MRKEKKRILPLNVAEEICASKYGNEVAEELKDICYKMRDLKMQMVNKLPFELVAHATYKFVWVLLYHIPPKDQVKFLKYCIEQIKETGKEWGE